MAEFAQALQIVISVVSFISIFVVHIRQPF